MAKAIKLSDELVTDAAIHGNAQHRSAPRQIEYWARIGKLADENPDLPLGFITLILFGNFNYRGPADAKRTFNDKGKKTYRMAQEKRTVGIAGY